MQPQQPVIVRMLRLHFLDQVFIVPESHAAQAGGRLLAGIKILIPSADGAD